MFFEPGIFEAAKAKGLATLTDVNHDGRIDQADLTLATKAKATVPEPKQVCKFRDLKDAGE